MFVLFLLYASKCSSFLFPFFLSSSKFRDSHEKSGRAEIPVPLRKGKEGVDGCPRYHQILL